MDKARVLNGVAPAFLLRAVKEHAGATLDRVAMIKDGWIRTGRR